MRILEILLLLLLSIINLLRLGYGCRALIMMMMARRMLYAMVVGRRDALVPYTPKEAWIVAKAASYLSQFYSLEPCFSMLHSEESYPVVLEKAR